MKSILVLSFVASFFSGFAFAEAKDTLPKGSYQCQRSAIDTTLIGTFYVRGDGSSKKVELLDTEKYENGSAVEGCYLVTFKWIENQETHKNAYCCPYGAN